MIVIVMRTYKTINFSKNFFFIAYSAILLSELMPVKKGYLKIEFLE